jgi:tricorn protease interacting factor F2/3
MTRSVRPIRYHLVLEPDIASFTFTGRLDLTIEAAEPVRDIVLNILELTVQGCAFDPDGRAESCDFTADTDKERLTVALPEETAGEIRLRIDYTGEINNKMAGFYRSRHIVHGAENHIAITQFQESDARRAFPCFDHPQMKAEFEIELVVDETLTAIANTTAVSEAPAGKGKKRVVFQTTPKMSTYLVFFGVGDFQIETDSADPRVRIITLPGGQRYGGFGLDFGRKALQYCEDYYAIPYPLPKMDLIAVPDFAFGAMENWGAITFRENLLLHYPGVTSRAGEERICEVIAHEIAHQWFGNLVTPSDWRYLWLNESFATYFGFGVVAHYHPEWGIWDQFLHSQTETALARDGLWENFPIEIPGGEHVVINSSTAPLIYNKGGSILRQIEGFIGEAAFQNGLRHYLKTHAYDCAASTDLWRAFETVSDKPVTAMMENWIGQPGHPMVTAVRDGGTLTLTQHRFAFLEKASEQVWQIPVQVRVFTDNGGERVLETYLDRRSTTLDIGTDAAAFKINDGQTGFYRSFYETETDLAALGRLAAENRLPPVDRWGLQNDLYAFVQGGRAAPAAYLDFLAYYETEEAPLPLMSIAENLFSLYRIIRGDVRERAGSVGKTLFERVLDTIGYLPVADEPHTVTILRDRIIWLAALFGSQTARTFCRERFAALTAGKGVPADILKSVLQVAALEGDPDRVDWFTDRLATAESEHERQTILLSLGAFGDTAALRKALRYTLDEAPDRNRFIPIVAAMANPYAAAMMWDWYVDHVDELEKMHPLLYERVIAAVVPVCGLERPDAVRSFFIDYMRRNGKVSDVVKLSLERLEIHQRMRG